MLKSIAAKRPQAGIALLGLVLGACASTPSQPIPQMIDTTTQSDVITRPVTIDGIQDITQLDPNSLAGQAPLERVIFFDYDRSELRPEFLDIVTQHGRFLALNSEARIRLEGHTDERGTREYNIALGDDRANTVARMLQLQGVGVEQIATVSYGEELPVDEAHNSEAWAKNRRVNIIYEVAIPN